MDSSSNLLPSLNHRRHHPLRLFPLREVSAIEAWVHTHRGSNPEDTNTLNTEEATLCLERYKTKATELNGPDFDWMNSPVDSRALYECSCGRPHGKWATFNGMVDDI
ncbi:hypothetical protein DAI22_10g114100 [Oryza sativa Japonica Group]|nr:hypothetical protein DAI22_10g114100 [Oryza sativa Japonica Group]